MKKYFILFVTLLILPLGVLAKSNDTIEIDMGKIHTYYEFSSSQYAAINLLFDKGVLVFSQEGQEEYICNSNSKKLVKVTNGRDLSVVPGITSADDIEYTITAEDRESYNGVQPQTQIFANKNKIVLKSGGDYVKSNDVNIYFYDVSKTLEETTFLALRMFNLSNSLGVVNISYDDDTRTDKMYRNGKLLATIDEQTYSVTMPSNVSEKDNFSFSFDTAMKLMGNTHQTVIKNQSDGPSSTAAYINYFAGKTINYLFAAEKDNPSVRITGLDIDKYSDGVTIAGTPTFNNLNINSDVVFDKEGDSIRYKLIINNSDNEDYRMSLDNLSSKYIEYTLESETGSNILKANSDTVVYLTVKYRYEAPASAFKDGVLIETKNLKINITGKDKDTNVIVNPKTRGVISIILLIGLLMVSSVLVVRSKKVQNKMLIILVGLLIATPVGVYALKEISLDVNSKVTIVKSDIKNRLYINGEEVTRVCYSNAGSSHRSSLESTAFRLEFSNSKDEMFYVYASTFGDKIYVEEINSNNNKITFNGTDNNYLMLISYFESKYTTSNLPESCSANDAIVLDGTEE